jgi:23S rRNA pseudouridine1911/1915/1917 synthase
LKNTNFIISAGSDGEDVEDRAEVGLDVELRELVFGEDQHGLRLDRALVDMVPEFSRSYLQQLIELGGVTVNGNVAFKASVRVKAGDAGVIELRPTPQSQAFKPEQMSLNIVHEDEHLMVIDKPAGLVVHPAPGNWSGTLQNAFLAHDAGVMNLPRAGIVHRLDKDTSGLLVVARTRPAMDALIKAIAARDVGRQYVAIAHKSWSGSRQRQVDAAVGRDPRNRLRMAVVDLEKSAGKTARTDIELLENSDLGCLVRCTLHTGRTHQIRVHMTSIGHPLLADLTYGGSVSAFIQRQALHAYRLSFVHPMSGRQMAFNAALPDDMKAALDHWSLRYNPSI